MKSAHMSFPERFPPGVSQKDSPTPGARPSILFYPVMGRSSAVLGAAPLNREGLSVPRSAFDESDHIGLSPRIGFFTGAAPALGRPEGPGRPKARPLHHHLMRPVGEAIEGAVGEDGIVEEGDPFLAGAVAGDHRCGSTMPFDEDVVKVAGLLGGELPKAKSSTIRTSQASQPRSSRSKELSAREACSAWSSWAALM